MKKFLCMILAFVMVFSFNTTAFADGPDVDAAPVLGEGVFQVDTPIQSGTRGLSGYASKFVSSSGEGSFTVTVTGNYSWKGGFTFKTSCDESNAAYAYITIQRPNSGYMLHDALFSANMEEPFTFYLVDTGTYTITYSVYVPSGATLQMQCWIYSL